MNIWIDVTNTPHVLFFKPIMKELRKRRHNVIITTRRHSQTIAMLDFFKLKYHIIGEHVGKSKIKKALNFFIRVKKLMKFMKNKKINAVVVHQSPYAMWAAKKLKIKKRIYIFDNETAKLQNLLAISTATHVICPEIIKGNYIKYPGLKESVYLNNFKPNPRVLKEMGVKNYIVIRPEPWTAAYYSGKKNFLMDTIQELTNKYNIIAIPRDKTQKKAYVNRFGDKIIIPKKAVDGASLIYYSKLLIGSGGTMNREAAVLGVPVISTYDGKLLAVDKWLIKKGLMVHCKTLTMALVEKVLKIKNKTNIQMLGKKALNHIIKVIIDENN